MAAQPLVRDPMTTPVETYRDQCHGHGQSARGGARCTLGVASIVIVTTDKCYENREWVWGYRENDRLGGHDPYTSSKACAELVTAAYRAVFLRRKRRCRARRRAPAMSSAAATGAATVWSPTSCAAFMAATGARIRIPDAVRPWQHVLEPLAGYLMLAKQAVVGTAATCADGWNFGPERPTSERDVVEVRGRCCASGAGSCAGRRTSNAPRTRPIFWPRHRQSARRARLAPRLAFEDALARTAAGIARMQRGEDMRALTRRQIDAS